MAELEELSIFCLIGVVQAKISTLIELADQLIACLCAPCPPGEPEEVIAVKGEIKVTAPPEDGFTAGAVTPGGTPVKGVRQI